MVVESWTTVRHAYLRMPEYSLVHRFSMNEVGKADRNREVRNDRSGPS